MAIKTAQSLSRADVAVCLTSLAAGDEAVLPAGTAAWTAPIKLTLPANVVIRGAGQGLSVIADNDPGSAPLLQLSSPGKIQLSGLTMKGGTGAAKWSGVVLVAGAKDSRVAHIDFRMRDYATLHNGLALMTGFYGCVDHCDFQLHGSGNGIRVNGTNDQAWSEPTGWGGSDFTVIEDVVFDGDSANGAAVDSMFGGKYVLREFVSNIPVQTHPTASDRNRGCRAWEVYHGKFQRSNFGDNPNRYALWISSGPGVAFDNDAVEGFVDFISLQAMRRSNASYPEQPPPQGWGYAGKSFNGVGSNWDGNEDPNTGYPNLDQPGRGQGDLLGGEFPNVRNVTRNADATSPNANPRQLNEGIYEWNNKHTVPNQWSGLKVRVSHPEIFQAGRDYHLDTPKPGYTPLPYPHYLVSGTTPEPPNQPPTVKIVTPSAGAVIAVNNYTITVIASDDTGVAWLELWINDQLATKVAATTLSYPWKTGPYKGKGPVTIKAIARDADKELVQASIKVTVKKS